MGKPYQSSFFILSVILLSVLMPSYWIINANAQTADYVIVDTSQTIFYDNSGTISIPQPDDAFYGQDANYEGTLPSYRDNGDGTVTDLSTGLMWQKTPDDKMTFEDAITGAESLNLAGYNDWRLPTIKELYSLILFNGTDPSGYEGSDTSGLIPFIATNYFDFEYGDTTAGERLIDAQYWSSTEYVGLTMSDDATVFGVNFADGRIKGYPRDIGPDGLPMKEFVRYVRGNPNYGQNNFVNNDDGTITDLSTGLMWQQADDGNEYTWEEALAYAENLEFAGYDDWRLPNAKELQSIVDYTRSPSTTDSAAIDPLFNVSTIINEAGQTDYPCYWTSTTHASQSVNQGGNAAYIAFGRAMGYMSGQWLDVHGAGAQRSDPKTGNPDNYPYGKGPQGDAIRIYNYVLVVRGGVTVISEFSASLIEFAMLFTIIFMAVIYLRKKL